MSLEEMDSIATLWAATLKDFDADEVSKALFNFMKNDKKGFLPQPAVVRDLIPKERYYRKNSPHMSWNIIRVIAHREDPEERRKGLRYLLPNERRALEDMGGEGILDAIRDEFPFGDCPLQETYNQTFRKYQNAALPQGGKSKNLLNVPDQGVA